MTSDAESLGIAARLTAVRARVERAAHAAGRQAGEVTTIVVTKFQPVSVVRELYDLGVRDFGESRHQEAREKATELPGDVVWHFVGQLQTKKARQVRAYSHVIHSVDRLGLVDALTGGAESTEVFVQVDLSGAPGRGGAQPDEVEVLAEQVVRAEGLTLRGVMAVAPLGEDPDRAFGRLHDISMRVRRLDPGATAISAGMSGDLENALGAGATHLRIGTAITGPRPPAT